MDYRGNHNYRHSQDICDDMGLDFDDYVVSSLELDGADFGRDNLDFGYDDGFGILVLGHDVVEGNLELDCDKCQDWELDDDLDNLKLDYDNDRGNLDLDQDLGDDLDNLELNRDFDDQDNLELELDLVLDGDLGNLDLDLDYDDDSAPDDVDVSGGSQNLDQNPQWDNNHIDYPQLVYESNPVF